MMIKSLLAMFAVAVPLIATLPAEKAEAKTNIDLNIGLGFGGGYYGRGHDAPIFLDDGDGFEIVEDDDAITCWQARKIVRLNGFRNVGAVDCSGPNYRFTGWRNGNKYTIRVNSWGDITRVRRW